jgi:hypothetical protein
VALCRSVHKFKQAAPACELIRAVELAKCSLSDREAYRRHAATCGDGAYVGRYSNQLVSEWCRQTMGSPMSDPCSEASCEFHILQHVGRVVDSKFSGALAFDDLLRFFKGRYSFGSRKFLARGVAARLGKRCFSFAAPRTDNFKVTVYSRNLHVRLLRDYEVFRLLLEVDLEILYLNLHQEALQRYKLELDKFNTGKRATRPKLPSTAAGVRTQMCKEMRSVGRTLMDPKILIFGIGRGDLRNVFIAAYATLTQSYKVSALVKVGCQHDMFLAMQSAIAGIAQLAGALRMLHTIMYDRSVCASRFSLGSQALRMHVMTFAVHYCWRYIPNVVKLLPGLLVHSEQGYVFQNLPIKVGLSRFSEPPPRKKMCYEERQAQFRTVRNVDAPAEIWRRTIEALDELCRWLRLELLEVRGRLVSWDTYPGAKCEVGVGIPRANENQDADSDVGSISSDEDHGLEEEGQVDPLGFTERPTRQRAEGVGQTSSSGEV